MWSLPASGDGGPAARTVEPQVAHSWIVANRASREPWQRADESLARVSAPSGLVVERGAEVTGAVVFAQDAETVTTLQIAALDDASVLRL